MKKILLAAFALLASLAFTACNEQKQEQKAAADFPAKHLSQTGDNQ